MQKPVLQGGDQGKVAEVFPGCGRKAGSDKGAGVPICSVDRDASFFVSRWGHMSTSCRLYRVGSIQQPSRAGRICLLVVGSTVLAVFICQPSRAGRFCRDVGHNRRRDGVLWWTGVFAVHSKLTPSVYVASQGRRNPWRWTRAAIDVAVPRKKRKGNAARVSNEKYAESTTSPSLRGPEHALNKKKVFQGSKTSNPLPC